jgi:hypothetical protein
VLQKYKFAAAMLLSATSIGVEATHVNTDGAGQIALLPFYSVSNGFITNLTITNTTNLYKAVKVRFHEQINGADVFDFNVYLAPYDVWNGTLRMNSANGTPNLISEDETCTYPDKAILQAGIDFINRYDSITNQDLSEGYVEIIEMGVLADGPGPAIDNEKFSEIDEDGFADGIINAGDRSIVDGLQHESSTGVPVDCSVVADAWLAGDADYRVNGFESGALSAEGVAQDSGGPGAPYGDTLNAGLVEPTGGIQVYSILLNAASGAGLVQQATHIDNYTTVAQHYRPDDQVNSLLPSLASGDVQRANIVSSDGSRVKSIIVPLTEYDTGALYDISPTPSIPMGSNPLPVSLVLSVDAVAAPYFVESSINGRTDIILSFPMRKHGIYNSGTLTNELDQDAPSSACAGSLNDGIDDGETVILESLLASVSDFPHDGAGNHCSNAGMLNNATPDIEVGFYYYDYAEKSAEVLINEYWEDWPTPPAVNPWLATVSLQHAVNIINVNLSDGSSGHTFGSASNSFYWGLEIGFEAGWVTIATADHYDYETNESIIEMTEAVGGIGAESGEWTGVPVIGFSAMVAELGSSQLGEVIELNRRVNRD